MAQKTIWQKALLEPPGEIEPWLANDGKNDGQYDSMIFFKKHGTSLKNLD